MVKRKAFFFEKKAKNFFRLVPSLGDGWHPDPDGEIRPIER
jgi:hypothetical protein